MACKCYHADKNFLGEIGVCWGTKECEPCACGGDESKCDFYDYVREKAKRDQTESLEMKSGERVYNPVYKCRLCGEKFRLPVVQLVQDGEFCAFKNEWHTSEKARHVCGDDQGIGEGDLIGFSPVHPEEPKAECNLYDKEETHKNCTVQVLTNTTTGGVSVGWWKNERSGVDIDYICRFLAEYFDSPCDYTIGGVDVPEILCTDEWCDGCINTPNSSQRCWKRLFEIWKERTGE